MTSDIEQESDSLASQKNSPHETGEGREMSEHEKQE